MQWILASVPHNLSKESLLSLLVQFLIFFMIYGFVGLNYPSMVFVLC